ncbi:MAG: hypothetical protein ACI865_000244 [Flavobacteriaceae bacterium]|jgi:hypothetical protein
MSAKSLEITDVFVKRRMIERYKQGKESCRLCFLRSPWFYVLRIN